MYFYDNHLGYGIYTSEEYLDYDDLYCDECGDSDTYLGEYASWEDFIKDYDVDYGPCFAPEYFAEMSGLTVERVLELNPKLADPFGDIEDDGE